MKQGKGKQIRGLNLIPSPQRIAGAGGSLIIESRPKIETPPGRTDPMEKLAKEQLLAAVGHLKSDETDAIIRIGTLARTESRGWLTHKDLDTLRALKSEQGYLLKVAGNLVTVVGTAPVGTLYGVQTLLQIFQETEKMEGGRISIPHLQIIDFPAVERRFLAPAMSWYAGYGRVGFASQLWGWEQWRWFIDWCLKHKINGINLCIYGYYPFNFPEYPETVFKEVQMKTWLEEAGEEITISYTHPNVRNEFLQKMIRYANDRAIEVYCYFGLNTFNGGYALAHPESRYFAKTNPEERFHQFRYNLCPSREDVKRYLEASTRKLVELGFNGFVLEESEGSGLCECDACRANYYNESMDSRKALHRADYELFDRLYKIIRRENPRAAIGVRMWRMGSEMGVDYLRNNRDKIPPDVLIFWSNGIDYEMFRGWVSVFGPHRIMAQDAELLGFSALYAGLIYMMPAQYSNYLRFVDPKYEASFPQTLQNDIRQYQQAARHGCRGVTGYAFNWSGWEIAPLSLAQYGWNPERLALDDFLDQGYIHLFGPVAGPLVAGAIRELPIVLETRVCEGTKEVPRDDPVSGGLAGLTSLQVPTRFGGGEKEILALKADLRRAQKALILIRRAQRIRLCEPRYMRSLSYIEIAARRTISICEAGIEYRRALELEGRLRPPRDQIISHLRASLERMEEDYKLVRRNTFDLSEEFLERITTAMETIRSRLNRWERGTK